MLGLLDSSTLSCCIDISVEVNLIFYPTFIDHISSKNKITACMIQLSTCERGIRRLCNDSVRMCFLKVGKHFYHDCQVSITTKLSRGTAVIYPSNRSLRKNKVSWNNFTIKDTLIVITAVLGVLLM